MTSTSRSFALLLAAIPAALLLSPADSQAERGSEYGAATYHVDVDCLTPAQRDRLEGMYAEARGAVSFDDISSRCVVEMAPAGAGVSPFEPCEGRLSHCALSAVTSVGPSGIEMLTLINPDSMHPECLVGANPTPHP